jgi:hypothetical protein
MSNGEVLVTLLIDWVPLGMLIVEKPLPMVTLSAAVGTPAPPVQLRESVQSPLWLKPVHVTAESRQRASSASAQQRCPPLAGWESRWAVAADERRGETRCGGTALRPAADIVSPFLWTFGQEMRSLIIVNAASDTRRKQDSSEGGPATNGDFGKAVKM